MAKPSRCLSQVDPPVQCVGAEVTQAETGRKVVVNQFGSGRRDQHLTSLRNGAQARAPVHGAPEVVAVAFLGLAAVNSHPHPQPLSQVPLKVRGCFQGGGRELEHRERRVALAAALDVDPTVLGDEPANQPVVFLDGRLHRGRIGLPALRRPL